MSKKIGYSEAHKTRTVIIQQPFRYFPNSLPIAHPLVKPVQLKPGVGAWMDRSSNWENLTTNWEDLA